MKLSQTIPVLLAAIIALGASSVHAGTAEYQLRPGSRWEYSTDDGGTESFSINRIVTIKGVPFVEMLRNEEKPYYLLHAGDDLYRFDTLPLPGTGEAVPILLLKGPLTVGRSWASPWGSIPLFFTILSEGSYTVPAGTFPETFKIGYRPDSDPIYQGYVWYSPSIGIIAMESNSYRSELRSYTISDLLPPLPVDGNMEEIASILGISLEGESLDLPAGRSGEENSSWTMRTTDRLLLPVFLLAVFVSTLLIILWFHRRIDLESDTGVIEGETALASVMVKEGMHADAARILQRLTEKNPQWPDLAALLGHAYREMGRLEDACLELKRALTLNQDMVSARLDLAAAYLSMDEPSRALDEVDDVLARHPRFADALLLRGEVYRALGKPRRAAEDFRAAIEINPSFEDALDQLAAIREGEEG